MSYIGQTLPTDVFGGYTTDTFAGDGSATTFTLSQAPFNEQGLIVVINNVIQQPTTNYTVSGTTLTIVGTAVASGDVIYARHTGVALPIGEANALDLQGQSDKLILDADADTTISADTDDQIDFKVGGTDVVTLTNSSLALKGTTPTLTIGDAGAEDTKIVFDGNAQDFYVGLDDSADDLIIGLGSTVGTTPIISVDENKDVSIPDGGLTITTSDNTTQLTLTSTDADADSGPHLSLFRNSGSVADNDLLGMIQFDGVDDGGNTTTYARFISQIIDAGDGSGGSEDTAFRLQTRVQGTLRSLFSLEGGTSGQGEIIVNDAQQDMDFRAESVGLTHALFVDAGNDRVGIGEASPDAVRLHVKNNNSNEYAIKAECSHATPEGIDVVFSAASDAPNSTFFAANDTGATRFIVNGEGDVENHDNSYGQISDERIKQNITDANSQWDDIKALKVRNFERKDDVREHGEGKKVQIGVIAQEVESVSPGLVKERSPSVGDIQSSSEFGTLYEDGDTLPKDKKIGDIKEIKDQVKKVSYSVLYMKAIKALQEAMAKIETLETKVKALEDA